MGLHEGQAGYFFFFFFFFSGCTGSWLWCSGFSNYSTWISVPQSRIELSSPALEGRFLTPGPPGKSPRRLFRGKQPPTYSRRATRLRTLSPAFLLCLPGCGPMCSPCQLSRTERSSFWAFSHTVPSTWLSLPSSSTRGFVHSVPGQPSPPDSCQHLMGRAGVASFWGSGVLGLRQCLGRRHCHRVDAACWAALPLPLGSECLKGRPTFLLTPQLLVLITVPGT